MSNEPGATMRPWLRCITVVGAAVVAVAPIAPSPALAQGTDRDSIRVYRAQVRRGDTIYVSALRATRQRLEGRFDSLKHEFEGLGLDAPDRGDVLHELRTTIAALVNLGSLERHVRVRVADPSAAAAMERAKARAFEKVQAFAGPLRLSMSSLQPGWIGINAEAPQQRIVRGDSAYIRYFGYPEIISVEPNSPAERVGITRGDQIVAYDGADVRDREINLTRLLQPTRRITVRVRRDGEEREFPIVVSTPPRRIIERMNLNMLDSLSDGRRGRVMVLRGAPVTPGDGPLVVFGQTDPGFIPIAGAKLAEINGKSFDTIFGVSSGVLVTEVFTDPARSSGLRGGDVIVRAEGQDITRIAQLRRIIDAHTDDRAIELEIVRQRRTRSLMLHW